VMSARSRAACCTHRSSERSSYSVRRSCRSSPHRGLAFARRAECEHLLYHGWLKVKLPARAMRFKRAASEALLGFFSRSNATKNKYRTRQEGEVVLSHPGYLTPDPGWQELLEIRRSQCDVSYKLPPSCRSPCLELFDELRAFVMSWLEVLSSFLCGDAAALSSLAINDSGPATLRGIHYDQVPDLAAQLASLPPERHDQGLQALRDAFPTHTDGTLLTLAPRGSCAGLLIRDYSTGEWISVEEDMEEDEAILFAGDALAFCTCHLLPALMHRPDGVEMARFAPARRLSLPFFLYPDADAILDSGRLRPELCAQHAARVLRPSPPTLPASHLPYNTNRCRDRMPWKGESYYDGLRMSKD